MTQRTGPLRVYLIDDEAPARERMRELLGDLAGEFPNRVVGEAANGREALERLAETPADVALVDIRMPTMGGVEFARHAQGLATPPSVVFVTAHDDYAIAAFELNALDYLLKPVRAARLAQALRKAVAGRLAALAQDGDARAAAEPQALTQSLRRADRGPRQFLSVSERGKVTLVPVADILFLRSELKYVTLRTAAGELVLEESLTSLEQEFGARFVRIHRSCLVALEHVRGVERVAGQGAEDGDARWAVRLAGVDEPLPVSRRQWPAIKALVKG